MKEYVLSGGYIIDENNAKRYIDMHIRDGRLVNIGLHVSDYHDIEVIDVSDKLLIPGLVDMHTHLRFPGLEHKEDISSGAKAALKGGFTEIFAMPNTKPVIDNVEIIQEVNKIAEKEYLKISHYAAITKGLNTEEIVEMEALSTYTKGFSNDGLGVQSAGVMYEAMKRAKKLNLPIIAHAEDESLLFDGVINEGRQSEKLNVKGINDLSEYLQVARDIEICEYMNAKYHVCHISSAKTMDKIKTAKEKGLKVSCEVTPHHLLLSENDVTCENYKMNPPLRTNEDRLALINGINNGIIDVIATDHAPHSKEEKNLGLEKSAFGIIGLEHGFSLCYTKLVKKDLLSLRKLIELMSYNPRKIMGLDNPFEIGNLADITVIDEEAMEIIDRENIASKSCNTPFIGEEIYGLTNKVIIDGKIVYERR